MARHGESFLNLLSSNNIDVEGFSLSQSMENPVPLTQNAKHIPKRSSNYTQEEDIQLCISWENVSNDPVIGNEQPGKAYWKRIYDHFHANKDFVSDRTGNSLEHRWGVIQKETSKFQSCYESVERRHPSGVTYKEHLLEAQALYASKDPKKKSFQFVHCWLKVRNCPKFHSLDNMKKTGPKRPAPSTPSESIADDAHLENESQKSGTPDSAMPPPKKRPKGRKAAKEKLKGDAHNNAIQELLVFKQGVEKMEEERWKEAKLMQEHKLSIEAQKFQWEQEQKIMFCDVSSFDPDVRTYVLAMRAQIDV